MRNFRSAAAATNRRGDLAGQVAHDAHGIVRRPRQG